MLTEEQLREIATSEAAATPAPWTWGMRYIGHYPHDWRPGDESMGYWKIAQIPDGQTAEDSQWENDTTFIAGARTWVPQLLAMVREQEQLVLVLRRQVGTLEAILGKTWDQIQQETSHVDRGTAAGD